MKNQRECAAICAQTNGGLFWTYNIRAKRCFIKSSNSIRRPLRGHVSGNKECGLGKTLSVKHHKLMYCKRSLKTCEKFRPFLNQLVLRVWVGVYQPFLPGDRRCPKGFFFDIPGRGVPDRVPSWVPGWVPGRIPSRGFKHRDNQELDQCAEFCNKTPECCSFEYSPKRRMCNLNKECKPTQSQLQDFVFCVSKRKFATSG